ncbi:zf-PARP-domain-containing protein, partial [Auriscalpium vulgare]
KKSGYRLEYATSNRAKCKGPKPCQGTTLVKDSLKLGSLVDFRGHTSYQWRHWGCTTPKLIANIKKQFEDAADLDNFEALKPEDQAKIKKAWEDGRVADEDIPESARKADGSPGEEDEDEEK